MIHANQTATAIRGGLLVLPGAIEKSDIGLRNGTIDCIGDISGDYSMQIDATGCFVIPGMIDLHTHGAVNIDVNSASDTDFKALSSFLASEGVTGYFPTVISDDPDAMLEAVRRIAHARFHEGGAKILGCHLEGPFLSPVYRGAMPPHCLIQGDAALVERFVEAANGCPLRITAAPEIDGVEALLPMLLSRGIHVSMGHSDACYETAMRCIRTGANCITHTMNAMRPLHHRKPGILGAALDSDVFCEVICDGFHLHPAIVRTLLYAKGIDRIVLVSDSMMAAGLGDGTFSLGGQTVIVIDSDAMLEDLQTRAGSTLTLHKALINWMQYTKLPLEQAILPLTANPACLLGLEAQKGRIDIGMDADLVILDHDMNVRYTIVGQTVVFQNQ